ncbi:MAG TPA: hypothetical protein VK589_23550 [Chryseolinea sp.]|nr:hypothetical protein [Chryseolinea sp.]
MKNILLIACFIVATLTSYSQNAASSFIFPDSTGWNILNENQTLRFNVRSTHQNQAVYYSLEGADGLGVEFDSLGHFRWTPSFDLVDRVQKSKDITLIFQQMLPDGKRERRDVTFMIRHINRPPVVEELPIVYVKQSNLNTYQIQSDFAYDPDGDPLVFKSILSQMPEGSALSSQGAFTWNPSRTQFALLKNQPLTVEFIVQDQPEKAETQGKLKIAQTQLDLPPEIMIVPGDSLFTIKEDEILNLKLYVSDPNGDDDVRNMGMLSSDKRVPQSILKENTMLQSEVTWSPGYSFVDDTQTAVNTELIFYAVDRSNNRTQRKVKVRVADAENLIKKDAHQFQKYRSNLVDALILVQQLDDNQKKLNSDYKKAKKGKKNRSIVNASLGAVTGFTPVIVDDPQNAKVVAGIGGTTVLTFGTLEATEVIGRSKEGILEKIKISIDLRNKVQSTGDDFARKYALKVTRRGPEFEKDIEKFRSALNDQRIVLLELDAYSKNKVVEDKDIKKVFVDFVEEQKQ